MQVITMEEAVAGREYVYLAEFVGGFVKIGRSITPEQRLRGIERRNQIPINNVCLVEGNHNLETFLHKTHKADRRYSEWFEISFDNLLTYIEKLQPEEIPAYQKEKVYRKKIEKEYGTCLLVDTVSLSSDREYEAYGEKIQNTLNIIATTREYLNMSLNDLKNDVLYLLDDKDYQEDIKEELQTINTIGDFVLNFFMFETAVFKDITTSYINGEVTYREVVEYIVSDIAIHIIQINKKHRTHVEYLKFPELQKLQNTLQELLSKDLDDVSLFHAVLTKV